MNTRGLSIPMVFLGLVLAATMGLSQDFDYRREESPAISWNGVGLFDARYLATGGISLLGSPVFAALSNPALLGGCRQFSVSSSGGFMSYQAYQYWGVNQGVLKAPDGLDESRLLISGLSLVIPLKKIHVSLGWAVSDIPDFPDFSQDQYQWGYAGEFQGREDRFFLAAAFQVARKWHLGVTLEYLKGNRQVDLTEHFYYNGGYYTLIQQQEQHRSTAFSTSFGALFAVSPSWKLGLSFRYPFSGQVNREITRRFENNFPSPSIVDRAGDTDNFQWPPSITLGVAFSPAVKKGSGSERKLTLALEGEFVWWSGYGYVYFQEALDRNMRDTLILSLGCEYTRSGKTADTFYRAGICLDPQPPKAPRTTLLTLSCGAGLRWKKIQGDIGLAYFTGGSGEFTQSHMVLCATVKYVNRGGKP